MSRMSDYALETRTWGQAAEDAALDARDLDRWITREDPRLAAEPTGANGPRCPICGGALRPFGVRIERWLCTPCDAIWCEGDLYANDDDTADLPF